MTEQFSEDRSDAIRMTLIDEAQRSRSPQRPRLLWAAVLVLAGALGGAGLSAAAFAAGAPPTAIPSHSPSPALPGAIEAPPGTIPGAPVISMLGEPMQFSVSGEAERPLDDRPDSSTHARVTVTLLAPGRVSWGTNADGNNPSSSATAADIGRGGATGWMDLPLDSSTPSLYLTATPGTEAAVSVQYVTHVPTRLGVNAKGETYGVEGGPDGAPDLIGVSGVAPDGSMVEGYARSTDLNAFSPEHPEQPSNPDEALEWQEERERSHPDGWDIPVFRSDGITRVGTFHIGN